MNLKILGIKLEDFRNYRSFESQGFGTFNIFIGPNGSGKTNLMEAIQLMTSLESFRNPKWDEVVRNGTERASIETSFSSTQRDLVVALGIQDGKREYTLNGKKKRGRELRGLLPSVLFTPDDLQLVKGGAENRRDSIDSMGTQISATYYDLKSKYQKAAKQKNILLQDPCFDSRLLDPWNENLAQIGAVFVKHRLNLLRIFRKNLFRIYLELAKENEISLLYSPSWKEDDIDLDGDEPDASQIADEMYRKMSSLREEEIRAGRALVGPHRDGITVLMNGMDARRFASQGQQRLIALSWKTAELETIGQICQQQPVLLLDDVMSELDRGKREILIEFLMKGSQTFITATDVDNLDDRIIDKAKIIDIGTAHGA